MGNPVGGNMELNRADFQKLLLKFKKLQINGYVVIDIMTNNGAEEGILLFNSGDVIAAQYEYLNQEKIVDGDDALPLVLNASTSPGFFNFYEFASKDVELAKSFNKQQLLSKLPVAEDIAAMIPDTFQESELKKEEVERKIKPGHVVKKTGVTKEDVLKKYGIVHPDEKKVDELLEMVGA